LRQVHGDQVAEPEGTQRLAREKPQRPRVPPGHQPDDHRPIESLLFADEGPQDLLHRIVEKPDQRHALHGLLDESEERVPEERRREPADEGDQPDGHDEAGPVPGEAEPAVHRAEDAPADVERQGDRGDEQEAVHEVADDAVHQQHLVGESA